MLVLKGVSTTARGRTPKVSRGPRLIEHPSAKLEGLEHCEECVCLLPRRIGPAGGSGLRLSLRDGLCSWLSREAAGSLGRRGASGKVMDRERWAKARGRCPI